MPSKIQRELAFLLTGRDVSATKSLDKVDRAILRVNEHGSKAARNVGRNLERGITVGAFAAAGAIGYSVTKAIEFETSSASVAKTAGAAWKEVVEANRALARDIPVNVNELNEISAAAAAMGVEGAADISAFTKTISLLSETADDVDTESGAEFLGHLRTNMQLTGPEIEHIGDLVTHLGNNSAATEGQILAMSESVSGAAGFINASTDDVVAWSAAMASAGEEAEAGGSAIQRVWIDSAKWVAKGGKSLKTLADISGVSAKEFKRSYEKDAGRTLARFIAKLGKLSKAEQLTTLAALGWDDIRITRALGKLLANTDNLTSAYEQTGHAAGAAAKEAEVRFATTASQLQILRNNVDDAAITIGSALLPQINELAKEGTDWLQGHQAEIAEFSQDLADNIRDAVTWAKSLDWERIFSSLEAGANFAKTMVEWFLKLPAPLQEFLAAGFVANKFSGGVVGDVLGDVLKTSIKGALGINAGVVNLRGGVVNGAGGVGGAAGVAGGGIGRLGKLLLVGELVTAGLAVYQTWQDQMSMNSQIASDINASLQAGIDVKTPAELQLALDGVNQGIHDIESNPLNVLVGGDALNTLKGMRTDLKSKLGNSELGKQPGRDKWQPSGVSGGTAPTTSRAAAGMQGWAAGREPWSKPIRELQAHAVTGFDDVKGATDKVGVIGQQGVVAVDRHRGATVAAGQNVASATRTGTAGTTAATNLGASRIVGAIGRIPAPVTTVKVYVTAATVKTSVTQSERAGNTTGSSGSGSNGTNKYE